MAVTSGLLQTTTTSQWISPGIQPPVILAADRLLQVKPQPSRPAAMPKLQRSIINSPRLSGHGTTIRNPSVFTLKNAKFKGTSISNLIMSARMTPVTSGRSRTAMISRLNLPGTPTKMGSTAVTRFLRTTPPLSQLTIKPRPSRSVINSLRSLAVVVGVEIPTSSS